MYGVGNGATGPRGIETTAAIAVMTAAATAAVRKPRPR
jgi:hypothetical protein